MKALSGGTLPNYFRFQPSNNVIFCEVVTILANNEALTGINCQTRQNNNPLPLPPSHSHLPTLTFLQAGEDFVSKTLSSIQYSEDPVAAVKSCDLVVEAIVENIDVKRELFAKLDQNAPRYTTCRV